LLFHYIIHHMAAPVEALSHDGSVSTILSRSGRDRKAD